MPSPAGLKTPLSAGAGGLGQGPLHRGRGAHRQRSRRRAQGSRGLRLEGPTPHPPTPFASTLRSQTKHDFAKQYFSNICPRIVAQARLDGRVNSQNTLGAAFGGALWGSTPPGAGCSDDGIGSPSGHGEPFFDRRLKNTAWPGHALLGSNTSNASSLVQ